MYHHTVYTDEQITAIKTACDALVETLPENTERLRESGQKLREAIGNSELLIAMVGATIRESPHLAILLYPVTGMAFQMGIEVGRLSALAEGEALAQALAQPEVHPV